MRWSLLLACLVLIAPLASGQDDVQPGYEAAEGPSVVDLSIAFTPEGHAGTDMAMTTQDHVPDASKAGDIDGECASKTTWNVAASPNRWPLQNESPYHKVRPAYLQANTTFPDHQTTLTWPVVFASTPVGPFTFEVRLDIGEDPMMFGPRTTMANHASGPLLRGADGLQLVPHEDQDVYLFTAELDIAQTTGRVHEWVGLHVNVTHGACAPNEEPAALYSHPDLHGGLSMAVDRPIDVQRWFMHQNEHGVFVELWTAHPWGATDLIITTDPPMQEMNFYTPSHSMMYPEHTGPHILRFPVTDGPVRIDITDRQGTAAASIEIPVQELERLDCTPASCTTYAPAPQNNESPPAPALLLPIALLGGLAAVRRR